MKNLIPGTVVLLVLMAAFAACTEQQPVENGAVITYTLYGGFVMPAYAVQELVVTEHMATFTIRSSDGAVTREYRRNLTKEQYDAIVQVFADNNFTAFGDRYVEGESHVTDVGYADINFTANGKSKVVTTYNYNDFMPQGLITIREKLQETIVYVTTLDEAQIKELAKDWIQKAPTYSYDGSGLQLVGYVRQDSDPVRHVLTYNFTSSHAGFGNRTGKVTAQVITPHTIFVTIIDSTVDSAVIDGRWDEMGQFIIGSDESLTFRPKKCEKPPWQVWEENSGRVYIRMPTDEEIIRNYYASVYETDVRDVRKVQVAEVTCEACSVCPETYQFSLTVNTGRMLPLLDEGWERTGEKK